MNNQFDLERFVQAQDPVYPSVLEELGSGRKRTHWMWFIFPQIAGLGSSAMAKKYAIASSDEAAAYLAHPVLGQRLRKCSALVLEHAGEDIGAIFGSPDDRKFHSSMTLFSEVAPDEAVFQDCINEFFDGLPDEATLDRL
ncbi:MAG: calpastatin [Massilia sp.]|nr:calpastatin [Massilia sp.]